MLFALLNHTFELPITNITLNLVRIRMNPPKFKEKLLPHEYIQY